MREILRKYQKQLVAGLLVALLLASSAWFFFHGRSASMAETDLNGLNDFELGQYYFNHGPRADGTYDLKKARHHFEQALADRPKAYPMAWYQLGRIDFLEGKFDQAIYKFDVQKKYFGDGVPNVHYMLGLTYGYKARRTGDEEDWRKAEEAFLKYLEFDKYDAWAYVDLSWVLFSQGRFSDMLPILDNALGNRPDNPWLHNMYGLALMNTGKRDEARGHFEEARKYAAGLTPEEWGRSYPGNDPDLWKEGLEEFQRLIEKNLELVKE